ncbi:MAG: PIG-L family deacetylase, partial [Bryobacteraceae bacterium]
VIITPHGDDFAIHAGGAIAKMTAEGWEAYLVRVTNDEKHSAGISTAETRLRNMRETDKAAKILGIREVIHLNYKDGDLQSASETELRARITTIFRTLRPDALMTCDPWTRYDDNFDHEKVGRAVEDAAWTSGNDKFLPELQRAGLAPFAVPTRYYWSAGQRYVNHVVDITGTLARKKEALAALATSATWRSKRFRGAENPREEFHFTKGSGLQEPYIEWYTGQLRSGKPWAAPTGPARQAAVPDGKGKVLVIVQPHADDFSGFAGGAVLQLIQAGYTAYIVNVSNDEKDYHGLPLTTGQTIDRNAAELREVARLAGIKEVLNLNLKNDEMESFPHTELRGRLILAFRTLKPDVIFAYDPWSLYERNPDHARVARTAAEAAWASGNEHFHPEHFALGLKPHMVRERYYFPRGPSDINRFFAIPDAVLETKLRLVKGHKTMMQSTANKLRDQLAIAGMRMPQLDLEGDRFYLRMADIFERDRLEKLGLQYGVKYAEHFHYDSEE